MHLFTFADTDYLPIPVTDMPINTDIFQNRGGGVENHLKFKCINCICNDNVINVINCMGSQLLQCFIQFCYYLLSWKRKPSSYKTAKPAYQTVFLVGLQTLCEE